MRKNQIAKIKGPKELIKFIKNPAKISAMIAGIISSGKSEMVLSGGRLLQASFKLRLLKQLGEELNKYLEKGELKENVFDDIKNQDSFYELLKFIDEETPDEVRFNAVKTIFLKSISKEITDKEKYLAHRLMQITKQLSSSQLLILKAAYDICEGNDVIVPKDTIKENSAKRWIHVIAEQIGHNMTNLIEIDEQKLIDLKLISKRTMSDNSGIEPTNHFRLTDLGYILCGFIVS